MRDVRNLEISVPPSWPSAGIVDALAFSVGRSDVVHRVTHASPNLVRGACGIVAHVVEREGRLAYWRDAYATCGTCLS